MPSPESSRSNLEHARRIGRVKYWRSRAESQRAKAEILRAYFAVPRPSQRAVAQRLRVRQPYVAKLFRKIRREGPEKAVGPEAYEQYKELRDAELSNRHESLVSEWERSRGTSAPKESHSSVGAIPAHQEGPTENVELAHDTNGNVIEIRDATRPPPAAVSPNDTRLPQSAGIHTYRIWTPERERVDDLLRMWAGINPNRSQGWFRVGF